MRARTFLAFALAAATASASKHKPAIANPAAPEKYEQSANGVVPGPAQLAHWWTVFGDEELNRLVLHAAEYNTDVRIATARVVEARALQGVTRAALLPALNSTNSF